MRHGGHILKCPTIKTDDVGNIYFSKRLNCFSPKIKMAANYTARKILMTSLILTPFYEFGIPTEVTYLTFRFIFRPGYRCKHGKGELGTTQLKYFFFFIQCVERRSLSEFKPHGTIQHCF